LEEYAARFDDLFGRLAQRRGFREYLAGLLAPRDRSRTLTALAGAEPVTGARLPAVQRLQFFLSESRWDPDKVNDRRLELLLADPGTAPHDAGVLVTGDSGDRKDWVKTAHVGHQWLGRYGKAGNGVVTVTTAWADERLYYPVHAVPCTPARHFAEGRNDPAFRTKLAIGADLAARARAAGFTFRAVAAGSACGDQDGFRSELAEAGLPFVMALKPRRGTRARGPDARTPADAARGLRWGGPGDPGDWHPVARTFRDGHTETWQAADAAPGWRGPDGARRLVAATADPGTLPAKATWYLVTSLPRPGSPREAGSPHPAADLAEIVRTCGIRHWTGQSCKQVKDELGWAGRLPGPLRHRDPPPPGTGQLRVQLLPGRLVRPSRDPRRHAARARRRRRREGAPRPPGPGQPPPSWPRAIRAVHAWPAPRIAPQRWWTAGSNAPRPASSKP
jgi:hypothetical protein